MGLNKIMEEIMGIIVHMHTDTDNRHYKVFVSEQDYNEIRASVHSWFDHSDTHSVDMEPTDYQNGRCLYYCMGFKVLIEKDEDREYGKPVIITN